MTASGVFTELRHPTPASGINQIALGGDGNLWFTERQAHKIGRLVPP